MPAIRLGIQLWAQATDWPSYAAAAQRVEALGYDDLWTWDHLISIVGADDQPVFEGYTTLAAWAVLTSRVRLGLLVGANTFRNPALVAKSIVTIDHISGGRAILGLGGGWNEREHAAMGVDYGRGFGDRLAWMDEALDVIRPLLRREVVSHRGPRYSTDRLEIKPPPVQDHLPIMIGGTGERKTLLSVARHADMWNAVMPLDDAPRKLAALRGHCEAVGRDLASIELTVDFKCVIRDDPGEAHAVVLRQMEHNHADPAVTVNDSYWIGTVEQIADRMRAFRDLGFTGFAIELPPPYDEETMVRLIGEVRPLVEQS